LATRKEPEAEGSPIMDDRANDGRGARMASLAEGMEGGCAAKDEGGRMKDELRRMDLKARTFPDTVPFNAKK
jgi:hypothetical protein